ncbi:hypothetical protein PR048_015335 [Dryococelus australis]|uniref:Uncharacterized protein n=1 Tax=Dryococelus australis TaxID=614101 RepID=A0ABQ9HH63_9NEOP|nr:hypothetical protein PR048_015335 [Dryococelus australis]
MAGCPLTCGDGDDDLLQFLSQLGYCPQFDALNTSLTGREMLQLFANLRGVPRDVDYEVNYWIRQLGQ